MHPRQRSSLAPAVRWAAPFALLLMAGSAPAEEFYYVAMFGSQTTPTDPNHSHSFATFVRAHGDGPCPTAFDVEDCFTISWLPANMIVRVHALLPECGHNFELHETLRYVLSEGERVSMWGPYRIDQELYDNAVRQAQLLQSGQVRYKAIDSGYPTDKVSNCIHAIASPAGGYRVRVLSPWFGETASWAVLQRYRPFIYDTDQTYDWVYEYLGLRCYPINRRDYGNPRAGPLRSALGIGE
jgi:hypothetical protein